MKLESELKAPYGKFRVVGVDTFDHTDWVDQDFDTVDEAIAHANKRGGNMLKMHVYDHFGNNLHSAGTY